MDKLVLRVIFLLSASSLCISSLLAQSKKVLFQTSYGDIKVELFDFTPNHRDLILNAIKDSVYQDALFNRIIDGFVVQGGEHDLDIEAREKENPNLQKNRLPAEFDDRAFHRLGALGAGRDANFEKASFLNQIYFVVGKVVTEADLNSLEQNKGITFTKEQRIEYLRNGGLPRLDKDYTVFGQIVSGLDVIMKISRLPTDSNNFPLEKVPFKLSEIN